MLSDSIDQHNSFDNTKNIKIYKGKAFLYRIKGTARKKQKVIVFDLDETIGSFGELYILWQLINKQVNGSPLFDELLDLYPEFLRHGILNILEFLYHKKCSGECSRIFIYTNNQCSTHLYDGYNEQLSWVQLICLYLGKKIGTKTGLFDKIIGAFKIDGKTVEFSRTTNNKHLGDFIKCSVIPKSTEICFIDNTYYSGMLGDRVYYIKPRSYQHCLENAEIIKRFTNSSIYKRIDKSIDKNIDKNIDKSIDTSFDSILVKAFPNKRVTTYNLEADLAISQRLMYYLKEFFYLSTRKVKTRKFTVKLGKFTRKKR